MWIFHVRHKETGEELDIRGYNLRNAFSRASEELSRDLDPSDWIFLNQTYDD